MREGSRRPARLTKGRGASRVGPRIRLNRDGAQAAAAKKQSHGARRGRSGSGPRRRRTGVRRPATGRRPGWRPEDPSAGRAGGGRGPTSARAANSSSSTRRLADEGESRQAIAEPVSRRRGARGGVRVEERVVVREVRPGESHPPRLDERHGHGDPERQPSVRKGEAREAGQQYHRRQLVARDHGEVAEATHQDGSTRG